MNRHFSIVFAVMLLLQLVLVKYCQIGHMIYISILPAMILCQPTSRPTPLVILLAFLTGMCVDLLADGVVGLNTAALLPLALIQKPVIRLMIDEDVVERHYSFSFFRHGYIRVGGALLVMTLLYMILYMVLDNAGDRTAGFVILRIFLSSLVSMIFAMVATAMLSPKQKL